MPARARTARITQDGLGLDGALAQELAAGVQSTGSQAGGGDFVLVYMTRQDKRVRPEHCALHGWTWDLADASKAPKPPLGYGCRCRLEIIERPRGTPPETRAEAAAKFKNLQASLDRYGNAEVADLYLQDKLTTADLYQPSGALINRHQARAIVSSREAGEAPASALRAVQRLKDLGLAGKSLDRILADAAARIESGTAEREALRAAIMAEPQRGLVTRDTVGRAVDAIQAAGLLPGKAD